MRFVAATAIWLGMCVGAAALDEAQIERDCKPDARRLCSEFFPNRPAIIACLIENKNKLRPVCRRHEGELQ